MKNKAIESKRISLTKEQMHAFRRSHAIHSEIVALSVTKDLIDETLWSGVRKMFERKFNLEGVYIDNVTEEFVFPFEI